MIYVIDIFDHDVGDFIHSVEYADFNCVCADVAEMIDVCDFEDEYDDADISDELEKFRNIQPAVLKSLKAFNFANGYCVWTCDLPGHHRSIKVKQH